MTTYQDLIRSYSRDVASGHFDADLSPRQRRLVHVMLNLASNAGRAAVVYPPTDQTRDDVVKHLGEIIWESSALVGAYANASFDAPDVSTAHERTLTILRGI